MVLLKLLERTRCRCGRAQERSSGRQSLSEDVEETCLGEGCGDGEQG